MHDWRLIAHHGEPDRAIEWFQGSSRIAIGWGKVGDLSKRSVIGTAEIASLIRREYPQHRNAHLGGPSLWRFYGQMRPGDHVIVSDGNQRRIVMEVTGDYEWSKDPFPPNDYRHQYQHQRRARFCPEMDADEQWLRAGAMIAAGENIRWALVRMQR